MERIYYQLPSQLETHLDALDEDITFSHEGYNKQVFNMWEWK